MIHNRIRIARTSEDKDLVTIEERLAKGQPFYDTKTNRLFISEENNKKINTLVDSDAITSYISHKLHTPRKLKVKLNSTTDVTFDGSADQLAIPVIGTLPVVNGGTGVISSSMEANLTVKNATNVISTIAGKSISSIFESDGLTVKESSHSDVATDSDAIGNIRGNLITLAQLQNKFDNMEVKSIRGIDSTVGLIPVYGNGITLFYPWNREGYYFYSNDGMNYEKIVKNIGSINGYTTLLYYCNGRFYSRSGEYSTDGKNWLRTNMSVINNIHYIPEIGRYFCNAYSGSETYTSIDGINWSSTEYTMEDFPVFGNDTLVAVTESNMIYSKDFGTTWSKSEKVPRSATTSGIAGDFRWVTYAKGKFILSVNELSYSTDGITWTTSSATQASWYRAWMIINNPTYLASSLIAICTDGIVRSNDGIHWQLVKELENVYNIYAINFKDICIYVANISQANMIEIYYSVANLAFTKAASFSVQMQNMSVINDTIIINSTGGSIFSKDGKLWQFVVGTEGYYTNYSRLANGRIVFGSVSAIDGDPDVLSKPFYIEPTFNAIPLLTFK